MNVGHSIFQKTWLISLQAFLPPISKWTATRRRREMQPKPICIAIQRACQEGAMATLLDTQLAIRERA
jgi:hypothetical protein